MVNRKYVPKLRFKGFTDEWGRRKLGGVCSEIGDGLHSAPEYDEDGDYFFINGNNLVNGEIHVDAEETKRVSKETFEKNNCHLDENTVLLSINGTIGNLAYYRGENVMLGKSAAFLKARDVEKSFLYSLLQTSSVLNDFMHSLTGTTIKNLGLTAIKNTSIYIPNNVEQNIIGQFFTDLDNLIALHQRKCDKLKEYKKGCLQKMFPRGDADVPEVRFPGFTGAWERRKLIECCDYVDYRGKTPAKTAEGVFLVTAKNVKVGYIDYEISKEYISEDDYDEAMHRGFPLIGDVLITTEAPCGNVAQVDREDIALAQRIIKYRGHENLIDNTYLKHYLLSPYFQSVLEAKSTGGTVQGIKGSVLHQQTIISPKYEEQQKIGLFLDSIDNLIALQKRECEKYKELKKGLLQQMFV